MEHNLFIFGDSITYGCFDRDGGWAAQLSKELKIRVIEDADFNCNTYVFGISGDTSENLIKRIETDLAPRITDQDNVENIFLFAIGINDSQYYLDKDQGRYSAQDFRQNIEEIVSIAKAHKATQIGFVGLTPIDEDLLNPIPWFPNVAYLEKRVAEFNSIIEDVCAKQGLDFINLLPDWSKQDVKDHLFDGIHPNDEGHRRIFNAVTRKFPKFPSPTKKPPSP